MKTTVFDTPLALAQQSAALMVRAIQQKPDSLCCFAAGFTQNDTYDLFVKQVSKQSVPTNRLRIIGLDEWDGLDGTDPGSCRAYINARLINPLGLLPSQTLFFFDGKGDMTRQCEQADQILDACGSIDLLVLGIGMNGHIGFNEPGDTDTMRSHYHTLSATTVTVGGKYFLGNEPPKSGVTLGLRDLLQAQKILLQIVGTHKAPVTQSLLSSPPPETFPAAYLLTTNADIYIDKAAYPVSC